MTHPQAIIAAHEAAEKEAYRRGVIADSLPYRGVETRPKTFSVGHCAGNASEPWIDESTNELVVPTTGHSPDGHPYAGPTIRVPLA